MPVSKNTYSRHAHARNTRVSGWLLDILAKRDQVYQANSGNGAGIVAPLREAVAGPRAPVWCRDLLCRPSSDYALPYRQRRPLRSTSCRANCGPSVGIVHLLRSKGTDLNSVNGSEPHK
jgi:hypothetical protein